MKNVRERGRERALQSFCHFCFCVSLTSGYLTQDTIYLSRVQLVCYNDRSPSRKANHSHGVSHKPIQSCDNVAQSIVEPTVLVLAEQGCPDHR